MSKNKNIPIFIPILSIPGMMSEDLSKFHKKYSFVKLDNTESFNPIGIIDSKYGRAIVEVIIRPSINKT